MSNQTNDKITNLLMMALLNTDITQAQRKNIISALNIDKENGDKLIQMKRAFRSLDRVDQNNVEKTYNFFTQKFDKEKGVEL